MAIRFHRSVRIAKGVNLNLSKGGLGVSAGPKGAKLSLGPRGVYSTFSIPGTGISNRTKLSNLSTKPSLKATSKKQRSDVEVRIEIDTQTGAEHITLYSEGNQFEDSSLIRQLSRTQEFKQSLAAKREYTKNLIEEESELLNSIHTHSSSYPDWTKLHKHLCQSSSIESFTKAPPSKEILAQELRQKAQQEITPLFGKKKKQEQYVNHHLETAYQKQLKDWEEQKALFAQKKEQALQQKTVLLALEHPTKETLEAALATYLQKVALPVEFSVAFEISEDCKTVFLDLDLPEIEDYPTLKASLLASGKLSIKQKGIKEQKLAYARSVASLSLYFASLAFAVSPKIQDVTISAYTQRLQGATGTVEDQYVYSVIYQLPSFLDLNMELLDPVAALQSFEHRMNLTAAGDLRTIEPFALQKG
ncbi:MAG: DUF4236 domain-containing protein [Sphaerochaetaceae bacterium]